MINTCLGRRIDYLAQFQRCEVFGELEHVVPVYVVYPMVEFNIVEYFVLGYMQAYFVVDHGVCEVRYIKHVQCMYQVVVCGHQIL